MKKLLSTVASGLLLAAVLVLVDGGPAAAEPTTSVYRTDGVNGRAPSDTNAVRAHVWDMETIGNTVYVAGLFTDVIDSSGSWPEHDQGFLAAFDATSGDWIDWWTPQFNDPIWALDTLPNGNLLVAGEFTQVNGQPYQNIVALDAATGEIDTSFYAEVERPWSTEPSVVRDVYVDGDDVYVIGNFSHIKGGPTAWRIQVAKTARISASDGQPDLQWLPQISGRSGWGIVPSEDGQRVHLVGEFSYVNGEDGTSQLATVDSTVGDLVPGWDHGSNRAPVSFWPVGGIIYDADVHGNNLYVAGAEHFWERRDSLNGDSLQYEWSSNDTQHVETIDDRVYIGCHCKFAPPGEWVRTIDGPTGTVLADQTLDLTGGDGGWATTKAPDDCVWVGGDFRATSELQGSPTGNYWVGRFSRHCEPAGPTPHNVPSLEEPPPAGQFVGVGAEWSYLSGEHPTGWTEAGFNDASWDTGDAELGFGDGDEATVIPNTFGGQNIMSAVFRSSFAVADPGAVPYLELQLNVDDGATVWINGAPMVAENMPDGIIDADTRALTSVWGAAERDFSTYVLDSTDLVAGTNTIAVSVHQAYRQSADLTFDASLVSVDDAPNGTEPTPNIQVPQPPGVAGDELVAAGSDWAYLDGEAAPPADWADPAFDDSGWSTGPAQLGYGDGDEVTAISPGPNPNLPAETAYFRTEFEVADPAAYADLLVELLRDDGAAVYLNGVELGRDNLPAGALTPDTNALEYVFGGAESTFVPFTFPTADLVTGTNVLAVEVHQAPGSKDMSFDLRLEGVFN